MTTTSRSGVPRAGGFTLVEVMLALVVGLMLLAGVVGVFSASRTNFQVQDDLSRMQESGRFALELLTRDLRHSGFPGCMYNPGPMNAGMGAVSVDVQAAGIARVISGTEGTGTVPDEIQVVTTDGQGVMVDSVEPDTNPPQVWVASTAGFSSGDVAIIANCQKAIMFDVTGVTGNYLETNADLPITIGAATRVYRTPPVEYSVRDGGCGAGGVLADGDVVDPQDLRLCRDEFPFDDPNVETIAAGVESLQILYGEDDVGGVQYRTWDAVTDPGSIVSIRIGLLIAGETLSDVVDGPAAYSVLDKDLAIPAGNRNRLRKVFTSTIALRNQLQ